MRLDVFLEHSRIEPRAFAKTIGAVPETVRRYVRGERLPGWRVMLQLERVTKGAVTPNDFLPVAKLRATRLRGKAKAMRRVPQAAE